MRLCEVIKYKRQALGMSQTEFGNSIGVSQNTISKFENGEVMSDTVFNKIRTGADDYLASLSRDKYLNVQIKWRALALDEMSDEEQLLTLQNITLNASKLSMEITKRMCERKETGGY